MGRLTRMENHCSTEAPILASSDIHSPVYLPLFQRSLGEAERGACLFILAGDIVDKGVVAAAEPVFRAIKEKTNAKIVAVFGNEEYFDREEEFKKRYPDIVWLSDEYTVVDLDKESLAIIGTRGALQRPTRWQQRHMPWLSEVYRKRPEMLRNLIREARREAEYVIVVSHYALSHHTIIGEDRRFWPEIYSPEMEKVILEEKPDIAIHGHAHKGRPFANVGGIRIYNVALPLNKRVVPVYLGPRRHTLLDWIADR